MGKLSSQQKQLDNSKHPTIGIETNIINDIQKLFQENWSVALTKTEQQILKILYYEKSALNVYEIRQHLIFSTVYHVIEKLEEIRKDKKSFDSKLTDGKIHIDNNKKIVSDLDLEKYKDYPHISFSRAQVIGFYYNLYSIVRDYMIHGEFIIPGPKTVSDAFMKKVEKYGPSVDKQLKYKIPVYFKNKTTTEKMFSLVLKELQIEVYGFKTISDALDNLRSMNAVLTREVKTGKSKKVYFLNPLIIKHITS